MKIVSWNVAGFRKINSLDTWDYSDPDMGYFAEEIVKFSPDVICLQEVLIGDIDQVEVFAKKLYYNFHACVKMSPDHTGTNDWIGLGIISKTPLTEIKVITQPYPDFPLIFADGRKAQKFDKHLLIATTEGVKIITTQLQPLHYWKFNYLKEPALSYAKEIESLIVDNVTPTTILAGDFQITDLSLPFSRLFKYYKNALPKTVTRIRKNGNNTVSDHILIPKKFKVQRSQVIATNTDHLMCFTDIEVK